MAEVEVWLWYFAYGSNLEPDTFLGRRGMQPSEARPARLDGYRLVFDLPVGPGERGVANLERDAAGFVHGVAWRISEEDAGRLDRTEGVHRGYYQREAVELLDAEGGRLAAFTYTSPHGRPGRRPSERYLGLLLRGARHHGLAPEWIAWLDTLERAVDERKTG